MAFTNCSDIMTIDGFHSYTYDAEGNITQVDGGTTAKYYYNALNQRVRADVGGTSREYVFNLSGQRVSIWDGNTHGQVQGQYYWGSRPVAFYSGGSLHFQHQDWLGTERIRTNYSGATEASFASLPFGDSFSSSGSDNDPYHFAQLDHDTESNTDHAQFRNYSSTQGRWLSPDPYSGSYDPSNPQSFNRYAYVMNNPLSLVDPSGLASWCGNDGTDGNEGCDSNGDGNIDTSFSVTASGSQPPPPGTVLSTVDGVETIEGQGTKQPCGVFCPGDNFANPNTTGSFDYLTGIRFGAGSGYSSRSAPNSFAQVQGRGQYRTPQQCEALANKINQLLKVIAEKQGDLNNPSGNLILGRPYAGSVMGHQVKLGDHIDNLASVATEYERGCGGGPPAPPTNGSPAPSPVPIVVPPVLWPLTPVAPLAPMAAEGASAVEILEAILAGLAAI